MAHKKKGMDLKFQFFCPHCSSNKFIKNGHPHGGKHEFICKSCNRYFTEDSLKSYPPTNIPFPLIAYLLYFRRKVPEFSNMRKYRKFVIFWLNQLRISSEGVSRQTIHYWINNYDSYLDNVITFSESRDFVRQRVSKVLPPVRKPLSYGSALKVLEKKFGKIYCFGLIRSDPVFFQELVDVVSHYGVFGWEFLEDGFGGVSVGYRSLSIG
jgi:hypothetical protein